MHGTERWMKEMLESNKKLTRYKKKQTRQKKILLSWSLEPCLFINWSCCILSFFHRFLSLESNSSPLPPCTSNWQAPISQQKVLILKIHGWTTDAQIQHDEYLICFCWALQNWCQLVTHQNCGRECFSWKAEMWLDFSLNKQEFSRFSSFSWQKLQHKQLLLPASNLSSWKLEKIWFFGSFRFLVFDDDVLHSQTLNFFVFVCIPPLSLM